MIGEENKMELIVKLRKAGMAGRPVEFKASGIRAWAIKALCA